MCEKTPHVVPCRLPYSRAVLRRLFHARIGILRGEGGCGAVIAIALGLSGFAGCSGEEAARVSVPVRVDARDLQPLETDRGYRVELSEARLVARDLRFAVAGEEHASSGLLDWLVPKAYAHPGHYVGGDVTGELLGQFVTSWLPEAQAPLGLATLLEGEYRSASFAFGRATASLGLATTDPLVGHSAVLRGSATRSGIRRAFLAVLDISPEYAPVGMPFAAGVSAEAPLAIGFELLPREPLEQGTLFDGIDFARLPTDADGVVTLSPASQNAALIGAYERLSEALRSPGHFRMQGLAPE